MYVGRYNYEDLRKAAIDDPIRENRMALGEWFQNYGMEFWNGTHFDADGFALIPIYEWDDETDTGTVIDYELR